MLSVLDRPVGYKGLPCVVMGAVNLAAALPACKPGSQVIVFIPGHVIGRVLHACRIKQVLVVIEYIPVIPVWEGVGNVIVTKLFSSSLIHGQVQVVLLNKVIQGKELFLIRHLQQGSHILNPYDVRVRLCGRKADSHGIVILIRRGVNHLYLHIRVLGLVSINDGRKLGCGFIVPGGYGQNRLSLPCLGRGFLTDFPCASCFLAA